MSKRPAKAELRRAKAWRLSTGLHIDFFADAIGWSREAIYKFERDGGSANQWLRYKNACSGWDHYFNWDPLT